MAKNQQGNYCSLTKYPEMESGVYTRKNTTQGGIGKACNSDRECADGYSCNNKTYGDSVPIVYRRYQPQIKYLLETYNM